MVYLKIQTRFGGSILYTLEKDYSKDNNMERILKRKEGILGKNKRKDQGNVESQGNDKRPHYGNNNSNGGNNDKKAITID